MYQSKIVVCTSDSSWREILFYTKSFTKYSLIELSIDFGVRILDYLCPSYIVKLDPFTTGKWHKTNSSIQIANQHEAKQKVLLLVLHLLYETLTGLCGSHSHGQVVGHELSPGHGGQGPEGIVLGHIREHDDADQTGSGELGSWHWYWGCVDTCQQTIIIS